MNRAILGVVTAALLVFYGSAFAANGTWTGTISDSACGASRAAMTEHGKKATHWQQWLEHPERPLVRRIVFQVHLWVGAAAAAYLLLMSATASAIVFRNQFAGNSLIEWLVRLHTSLLIGITGRFLNGIGAGCLTTLCLTGGIIWWPGTKHWRRSLTVDWSGHFPRINWDLHSALGFWLFPFVLLWGVSGFYFFSPTLLTFSIPLILGAESPTLRWTGCPRCTSAGSGGSSKLFGCSWDWFPPSLRLPVSSFAAAG